MTTAYITHRDCELHDMGGDHPESPARLRAIRDYLMERQVWDLLLQVDAPKIEKKHLYRVHSRDYVDAIFEQFPLRDLRDLGPDVVANPHTLDAALRAAGGVCKAVDLVMTGEANNAFCAVRPPPCGPRRVARPLSPTSSKSESSCSSSSSSPNSSSCESCSSRRGGPFGMISISGS